jgi:hypothetical protein
MRFNSIVILTGAGLSDDSGDFIRGKSPRRIAAA